MSATEREVKALIRRVKNSKSSDATKPKEESPPKRGRRCPAAPAESDEPLEVSEDLDAKEKELEAHRLQLERQMRGVARQRAALQLQRRERALREASLEALKTLEARESNEIESRVNALKLELHEKEAKCQLHREQLKAQMEDLCRDYEAAAQITKDLRIDFEKTSQQLRDDFNSANLQRRTLADHAIAAQLEREALDLGFRMEKTNPASPSSSPPARKKQQEE